MAAERRSQVLSDSLDAHLAVLAIARFVLLRRKALPRSPPASAAEHAAPPLLTRDDVCSSATLHAWGKATRRIVRTLLDHDRSLRGRAEL